MDYWKKRLIEEQNRIYNGILANSEKELAKQYLRQAKETKNQIIILYNEIERDLIHNTVLASDFYRYNRYWELLENINKRLKQLGKQEIAIDENNLFMMYVRAGASVKESIGFNGDINEEQAKDAINSIWCADGKLWSDRVWFNKADMQQRLEEGIIDCVSRGLNKDKVVGYVMREFDVAYYKADRLIRTELSHVQNRSAQDRYKEAGITEVEWISGEDERECDDCQELNGKIFKIGEKIPPEHCNCRCSIIPIIKHNSL